MRPDGLLRRIPPGARADLLRLLTWPSNVRADVVRQLHERGIDLAEILMDLEADNALREQLATALRATLYPTA